MNVQRLADDVLHRHARIQRAVGVLENHLQLAPPRAQRRPAHPRKVFALEQNAPRRRLDQPHDGAAQRRLAATALAHQPQRFARRDAEAHVVHRLHVRTHAAEHPVLHREMDFQVLDFEEAHAKKSETRMSKFE